MSSTRHAIQLAMQMAKVDLAILLRVTAEENMVRRRGKKWVVLSEDGKVLGTHSSEEDANEQLAAIESSKARRKKGKR